MSNLPPPIPKAYWYYSKDGQTFGPYTGEVLQQKLQAGELTTRTLVAAAGDSGWRSLAEAMGTVPTPPPLAGGEKPTLLAGLAGKVSEASGLEKLEGFSLKHLFSEVTRKHSPEQIEEHFSVGTATTTPPLQSVNAAWPTPWAFVHLLGLSLASSLVLYWALMRFQNPNLIPGWIFVGCFGIPFSVLVFFIESNQLRNVSFYRVMALLIPGGILSLVTSLLIFEYTKLHSYIGAMSAGIVEEVGKLIAVIFFTRKWVKFGWTLNGMLFGAAVGTGFSAFESAGYVFVSMARNSEPETIMMMRAFLSPFTHTIWTAAAAAALWRVKGDRPFEMAMVGDPRFVRIFVIVAGLHMLWNSPLAIPIVGGDMGFIAFRILLGLVGWIVVLLLLQAGLKEVRAAQAGLASAGPDSGKLSSPS
ncbi:PrsW family glutamic-type intramembrane protease [Luteolibacter flavescens]|uniref:PrsW family glutamic-type intramembrane protease n=1 Tax=Luteolibacter flavescens TaxID=1859460 RepID=A0ABT3FUM3_9BACT|nr:PrsW family glutamic-type intramembrane protease [Luteolibacter flavescens]MCW1887281.1 PrsW family glutamic-type intramembrane protease [Luteolibacter flavescens]